MCHSKEKSDFSYCIGVDESLCTGCMACVLACSYHFNKTFSLTLGAICVYRDLKEGTIEVSISSLCNKCPEHDIPLCMQFCAPEAIFFKRKRESL